MLTGKLYQAKFSENASNAIDSGNLGNGPTGFDTILIICCCVFLGNWCECSFLGDNFSAVAIGRKCWFWCVFFVDVSCRFVFWTAPGCSRQFMTQELCIRRVC